jgi:hypothetical protein
MVPSRKEPKLNSVLVGGDLIVDHHTYKGGRKKAAWKEMVGTRMVSTLGGAHLTYSLLKQINPGANVDCWYDPELALNAIKAGHPENQAYAEWETARDGAHRFKRALGYGVVEDIKNSLDYERIHKSSLDERDLLVIDDGALGFRHSSVTSEMPRYKCCILKTNQPLLDGYLWKTLMNTERIDKLITLISIDELREYDIKVSRGISWEQTCLDLCYELVRHSLLKHLIRCKFLVVSMGGGGAVVIKNGSKKKAAEFALVYDAGFLEGEWETKEAAGGIGRMCAFTAGFTHNMIYRDVRDLEKIAISEVIECAKSGILYLRKMLQLKTGWPVPAEGSDPEALSANVLDAHAEATFSDAFIPSPYWYRPRSEYVKESSWSIFYNNYDRKLQLSETINHYTENIVLQAASWAARNGLDTLKNIPYLECRKLFTIDRHEIESLRNIRRLLSQYIASESAMPFNLGISGPPRTNRRFAVKQIVYSLFGKKEFNKRGVFLTFKLAQFSDKKDISGAFLQIRDQVMLGKLPFVFWEDIDSGNFKWLRYLLSPMKDGFIQDKNNIRQTGQCIFIFSGNSENGRFLYKPEEPDNGKLSKKTAKRERKRTKLLKARKVLEFRNNLDASLSISGVNRDDGYNASQEHWISGYQEDLMYPVRRVLYLRSGLGRQNDKKLKMDPGLIMAFLKTGEYKYGVKSMIQMLEHLKKGASGKISRSELPAVKFMSGHVDFDEFMSIANSNRAGKLPVEDLARAIHLTWMENGTGNNTPPALNQAYDALPAALKFDYLLTAKRILDMVSNLGFKVVRKEDLRPTMMVEFKIRYIRDENELEFLAGEEHKGWVKARKSAGWRSGLLRNDYLKRDPYLVKYKNLKSREKESARETIRCIPDYFEHLEYKIVRGKRGVLKL